MSSICVVCFPKDLSVKGAVIMTPRKRIENEFPVENKTYNVNCLVIPFIDGPLPKAVTHRILVCGLLLSNGFPIDTPDIVSAATERYLTMFSRVDDFHLHFKKPGTIFFESLEDGSFGRSDTNSLNYR